MRMEFGEYEKATPKTLNRVFLNTLAYLREYPQDAEYFCECFNELLDKLLRNDFFGTEGQCDPRGDHRS